MNRSVSRKPPRRRVPKGLKANYMNTIHNRSFKLNPVAAVMVLAMTAQIPANLAHANGAYGTNTDVSGRTINVPTYYANSPQGIQPAFDLANHVQSATIKIDTGKPLRKFVDKLPGAYNGLDGAGIPVAITEKWFNPLTQTQTNDDYYEIAIVEYTQQMHSDLAKPTTLRGYVQILTPAIAAGLKDVTGVVGADIDPKDGFIGIAATYPNGTPIMGADGVQVRWVHAPHYLGPVIVASKGTAVRIKATNYLPYTDVHNVPVGAPHGGALGIPVDETLAGGGPVLDVNGNPVLGLNMGQNRASIHWHGGDTPWISDGTPHQWFAPAGDISYIQGVDPLSRPHGMGKGASAANVPDMADPGDGSYTLYFPNNISGRLMFYHDHTSGLTRLNVYNGIAAGYVVTDPVELGLVSNAINPGKNLTLPDGKTLASAVPLLDAVGIPLVIQDKTFVPKNMGNPDLNPNAKASDGTPASQDAKWDLTHWGQEGDLFFPHVYETNQDPNSIDGTNPVGRWDWGPWFWPVFPAQMSLPTGEYGHVTTTPEAFMDTPVVNGLAYPTMTVDPKTYRFRILSAGNDRTLNLGLYQAVDAAGKVCDGKAIPAKGTPMAGGATLADCTEIKMVPALPTPGFPTNWPIDGRPGGVPDPATAGPDIVQIGNEGGLLPAPAIWKSQPVTYETNVRSITVFNVLQHDLLLGPAERADVLIDFSKYAGQTLLVYNDAPAPMPGFDPRIDYFTGTGDKTDAGGAHDTLPGYGPNTRTIMQIKVSNAAPAAPLNTAALFTALPAAYAKTQPAPNIPEAAYNAPFGTKSVNNYATIGTGSAATGGQFTYTEIDPVTGAKSSKTIPVINKAIQELFDPIYGRMNATLAVELPFSSATVATTIPLAYVDTPVERLDAIKDGETQIWKITHNGVDDHPVHFHLVNVQVINRVGWDGVIKPPEANEVGWKETLRMNPLEDVYVAVKAVRPAVPFGVPKSARLLDPSSAVNSQLGFTQIDATTGQTPSYQMQLVNGITTQVTTGVYSNQLTDFDNEYVWHCHILGHEENDFMRPFIFHPNVIVPDAPAAVTQVGNTLNWTDTTPVGGQDAQGIPTAGTNAAYPVATSSPKNEIGFKVIKNSIISTTNSPYQVVTTTTVKTTIADITTTATTVATQNVDALTTTKTASSIHAIAPANSTSWTGDLPATEMGASNTVAATNSTNSLTTKPAANTTVVTLTDTATQSYTTTSSLANTYALVAFNAMGDSDQGSITTTTGASASVVAAGPIAAPKSTVATMTNTATAPTGLTQTLNSNGSVTLSWTKVAGATGYTVTVNGVAQNVAGTSVRVSQANLAAGGNTFTVVAQTLSGTTNAAAASLYNGIAYAPVAVTASQGNQGNGSPSGSITLNWANSPLNVNNVTGLTLTWTLAGSTLTRSMRFAPTTTGTTLINLSRDMNYNFTLTANSAAGNSPAVLGTGHSSP